MSWQAIPEIVPVVLRMEKSEQEQLAIILNPVKNIVDASGHVRLVSALEAISRGIIRRKIKPSAAHALIIGKLSFYASKFLFLTGNGNEIYYQHPSFRVHVAVGWVFRANMARAMEILEQLKPRSTDPYFQAEMEAVKGFIHSVRRNVPEVLAAEEVIRRLAESDDDVFTHVLPLIVIRRVYLQRKTRQQIDDGIETLQQLIKDQKRNGNRFFVAKAHLRLGQLYSNIRLLKEAEIHYLESMRRSESISSTHLVSIAKNRLGMLLVERDQLEKAKMTFMEAIALARTCGAKWLEAAPLINLNQFFWNKENPELALRSIEYFLSIARRTEDPQDTLVALNILAHLHGMLGHVDVAISYMMQAIEARKLLLRLNQPTSAPS